MDLIGPVILAFDDLESRHFEKTVTPSDSEPSVVAKVWNLQSGHHFPGKEAGSSPPMACAPQDSWRRDYGGSQTSFVPSSTLTKSTGLRVSFLLYHKSVC